MKNRHMHPQHAIVEQIAITWLEAGNASWTYAFNQVHNQLGLPIPEKGIEQEMIMQAARVAATLTS